MVLPPSGGRRVQNESITRTGDKCSKEHEHECGALELLEESTLVVK